MALTDMLRRRIRSRKNDAEDDGNDLPSALSKVSHVSPDVDSDRSPLSEAENLEDADSETGDSDDDHSISSESTSPQNPLAEISFGALASAAASLGKRKRSPSSSLHPSKRRSPSPFHEESERLAGKKDHRVLARASKHAPTELSSKKAVSRKRSVVPIPTIKHRDPRFEALSGPLDTAKVANNYSFLDDYRASEIAALKVQIRKAKDPVAKEGLKKQLISMESREKARKAKNLEQEVLREHRRREKAMVEKGKKPFFLKKGEQKKLALIKKFEGLGEKKVDKLIERRRKKKAGRERKSMPFGRRGLDVVPGS